MLLIRPTYKIAAMAVGSKTFPQDSAPGPVTVSKSWGSSAVRSRSADWLEVLFVFAVFEGVLWTPRSLAHSVMIATVVVCVVWFSFRRNSRAELGLVWPAQGGAWILAVGVLAAIAIPAGSDCNWPSSAGESGLAEVSQSVAVRHLGVRSAVSVTIVFLFAAGIAGRSALGGGRQHLPVYPGSSAQPGSDCHDGHRCTFLC